MSITFTLHLHYIYRTCTSYLHYTYVTSPSHSHYMYIAFRVHDIALQTLHTRYTIHYMHPYIYAMLRGAAFLHALGLGCWFELVLGWDTPIDLPFVLRRIHDPQFVGGSECRSAAVRAFQDRKDTHFTGLRFHGFREGLLCSKKLPAYDPNFHTRSAALLQPNILT